MKDERTRTTEALVLICVAMLMGGQAAGSESTNSTLEQLRLEVSLSDGSRIIGTPRIDAVPVQTPYAKMDIPLKQILTVLMGDDHETASLDLRNGDKLKGVVSLGPIELVTVFGPVKAGIEHVRRIDVGLSGEGLARGLLVHYPFDNEEGNRVTDASGNGHNSTVQGARWTPDGRIWGAYVFDGGDDHVDANVIGLGPGTKEMSVVCWIKATRMTPCAGLVCDRYQPLSLHCLRGLILDGRDQTHQPAFFVPGGAVVAPEETMKPGEWTHLAGVWKAGAILRIYVNGKLARSNDEQAPGATTYQSGRWKIGWDEDQPSRRFNGVIDDVRIYDRALSEAEVQQLFAR